MATTATWLVRAAGVSGAAAVALGTYGAHGFQPKDPHFRQVGTRQLVEGGRAPLH
jgi:uncharacterized membrane protein YgdD (TMEM256/DUF423 family)